MTIATWSFVDMSPWFATGLLTVIFLPALWHAYGGQWRTDRTPDADAAVSRSSRSLLILFLVSLAAVPALAWAGRAVDASEGWLLAFLPVWVAPGLATMPLNRIAATRNPPAHAGLPPVRAARLTPRGTEPVVPAWVPGAGYLAIASGATLTLAAAARLDWRPDAEFFASGQMVIWGLLLVIGFQWSSRMVMREPMPTVPDEPARVAADRHAVRLGRARLMAVLGAIVGGVMAVGGGLLALADASGWLTGEEIGRYGAIGGATIGVVGGLAGAYFGAKSARAERKWRDDLPRPDASVAQPSA